MQNRFRKRKYIDEFKKGWLSNTNIFLFTELFDWNLPSEEDLPLIKKKKNYTY